jgi:hypothetical protein
VVNTEVTESAERKRGEGIKEEKGKEKKRKEKN